MGLVGMQDGKVFGTTDSGPSTFTLHDKDGEPVLILEAVLNDGSHYYFEMTPIR